MGVCWTRVVNPVLAKRNLSEVRVSLGCPALGGFGFRLQVRFSRSRPPRRVRVTKRNQGTRFGRFSSFFVVILAVSLVVRISQLRVWWNYGFRKYGSCKYGFQERSSFGWLVRFRPQRDDATLAATLAYGCNALEGLRPARVASTLVFMPHASHQRVLSRRRP